MTVPLGNTPAPSTTPEELKTPGLVYMAQAAQRGEPPVILFYRTLEFGSAFAPDPQNIDPATQQPKLVHPVTVDVYFPNGPLAGRVYRRVGFINAGLTGSIRQTAIGSINVGQMNIATPKRGNPYAQLNALDPDAMAWANQVHQAAQGNVFRANDPAGEPGPAAAPAPQSSPAPPADRFAGMPVPGAGQAQAPGPAGMAAPNPPPGFPGAAPAAAAPAPPVGQPAPLTTPPPAGIPSLTGPPPGFPGSAPAGGPPAGEPPY